MSSEEPAPEITPARARTRFRSHAMCDACWFVLQPGRTPTRVRETETGLWASDDCCYCGKPTAGIYVRGTEASAAQCHCAVRTGE